MLLLDIEIVLYTISLKPFKNFIGGEAEAKRVKVTCALMTEPGFDLKSINFVNYKHSGRVLGICYFMPGVLHAYEALIFIITL